LTASKFEVLGQCQGGVKGAQLKACLKRVASTRRILFTIVLLAAEAMFAGIGNVEPAEAAEVRYIRDTETGGDCYLIGAWDDSSRTCTLTADSTAHLIIDDDDITFDGNGHALIGNGTEIDNDAVTVWGAEGVTVRNLITRDFSYGVHLIDSRYTTVTNLTATGNLGAGISLSMASNNTMSNNYISNNSMDTGICIGYASSNNTVTGTTVIGGERGIYLHDQSNGNTLTGNPLTGNINAITLYDSDSNNTISNNYIYSNSAAVYLHAGSYYNVITGNTFEDNRSGVYIAFGPAYNQVYNNNFLDNDNFEARLYDDGGANIFNRPDPTGGNHWSDYDSPDEGCADINVDGYCDAPYVFEGGRDEMPVTGQNGWSCTQPSLNLDKAKSVYWANYADYMNQELSIDWKVNNTGSTVAHNVDLIANYHSSGVVTVSQLPFPIGSIAANGGYGMATVKAIVPDGVSAFHSTVFVKAHDRCSAEYYFPRRP